MKSNTVTKLALGLLAVLASVNVVVYAQEAPSEVDAVPADGRNTTSRTIANLNVNQDDPNAAIQGSGISNTTATTTTDSSGSGVDGKTDAGVDATITNGTYAMDTLTNVNMTMDKIPDSGTINSTSATSAVVDLSKISGSQRTGFATFMIKNNVQVNIITDYLSDDVETVAADGRQYMIPSDFISPEGTVGSCGFILNYNDTMVPMMSLNRAEFVDDSGTGVTNEAMTGKCFRCFNVTGPSGSVIARVASMANPKHGNGVIELSKPAALAIAADAQVGKPIAVTYDAITCPYMRDTDN
jgi:hypothetical protein